MVSTCPQHQQRPPGHAPLILAGHHLQAIEVFLGPRGHSGGLSCLGLSLFESGLTVPFITDVQLAWVL